MGSSNPVPDQHVEVLQRQAFNTIGALATGSLTQDNRVGNAQKVANTRLNANTPKGLLAGSVVAVAGNGLIGACAGDSTTADKAVGIAINNAVGNPFESSSGVGSGKCVYAHGTGTVLRTDIYETYKQDGSTPVAYTAGDLLYSSQNGLLINVLDSTNNAPYATIIGICLSAPTATDSYLSVQMRI